jgi:hypothetical protein
VLPDVVGVAVAIVGAINAFTGTVKIPVWILAKLNEDRSNPPGAGGKMFRLFVEGSGALLNTLRSNPAFGSFGIAGQFH